MILQVLPGREAYLAFIARRCMHDVLCVCGNMSITEVADGLWANGHTYLNELKIGMELCLTYRTIIVDLAHPVKNRSTGLGVFLLVYDQTMLRQRSENR